MTSIYSERFANPIYQHSGESEKIPAIAQQASVNEDQEQRRRQLDARGEKQRILVAKEVSHIIDEVGGRVQLKETPFELPKEPLLQQAQHTASQAIQSTIETGKSVINSAAASTAAAINSATATTAAAADKVTTATKEAASTVTHIGYDAAGRVSSAAKSALFNVTHAAQEVGHRAAAIAGKVKYTTTHTAATIAEKVIDTTTHTAEAVSHKTKELADRASAKAHEVAENISHFTTLVGVLAEEENERSRRLVSGDEAIMAANAFRVSELIRDLGIAFYKQETPNLNYCTKILEEAERRWRLNSSTTSRAESNAHLLGKMVKSNIQSFAPRNEWARANIIHLEEAERARRINDPSEVLAIINAYTISNLVSNTFSYTQQFSRQYWSYATTLLEENERRYRIIQWRATHTRDASHILQDLVADNIEKFNYSTRHAAQFANGHMTSYLRQKAHEFAHLLGNATKHFASTFSHQAKDIANKTATRVTAAADNLVHYGTRVYVIALEEKERTRRINDPAEINAIYNAWCQSQLIRNLPYLYHATSFARFPTHLIEEQERRWRLTHVTPASSRKLAALVAAHHLKFEQAGLRWSAQLHARDVAAHSRLNPNAPEFVPHQQTFTKVEPAIVQQNNLRAAGAQF